MFHNVLKHNQLNKASFTYDPTGKKIRLDYGTSVSPSGFILWNGGFNEANAQYGQSFIVRKWINNPLLTLKSYHKLYQQPSSSDYTY